MNWRRDRDYSALKLELHRHSSAFQADRRTPVRLSLVVEPRPLGFKSDFPHHLQQNPHKAGFVVNGGEIGIRTLGTPIGVQLISSQPHSTTLPSLHSRLHLNKIKSNNLQVKFHGFEIFLASMHKFNQTP